MTNIIIPDPPTPGKSATDKVLELPLESVIYVTYGDRRAGLATVLHRTGPNGWLSTRWIGSQPGYLGGKEVRAFLEKAERDSGTFTLLVEAGVPV